MHTRSFVTVVGASLLLAQGVGCGETDEAPAPTVPSSGGSGGSGGNTGTSGAGGTRSNEGGSAGMAGAPATTGPSAAGSAGAAGSPPTDELPQSCDEIPHEDPADDCEPVLRAIVTSQGNVRQLLTFEYDAAGRLVTVGDQRDHSSYFVHRYTYDEAGRLTRFEDDCPPVGGTESCDATYEFSYAEAGWLQELVLFYGESSDQSLTETYGEDGALLERLNVQSGGTRVTTYQYRSDGQVDTRQSFSVDESGIRIPDVTSTYVYGDDDLVDDIECVDAAGDVDYSCNERFSYALEEGRVRWRSRSWGEGEYGHTIIFDDQGFPAFERWSLQGEDQGVSAVINGTDTPAAWVAKPQPRTLDIPIDASSRYRPSAVTEGVIEDFSYTYYDLPLSRQVTLGDDGMIDRLTATWGSGTKLEFVSLRCGGVVLETIQYQYPQDTDTTATYYYYGCDDFVLPSPLPVP